MLLSVLSFIAILLVSRLEEIAQFATLGAKPSHLLLFILYQIPYIIPIALPLSSLLASMIVVQRLSQTHELTALRAGGLSLRMVVAPLLFAGAFLFLLTFTLASEVATSSHLATRQMAYRLTAENPLLLLSSAKLAKQKNVYVQMDTVKSGKALKNLILALPNPSQNRMALCLAKKVESEGPFLKAYEVTLLSTIPSETFDHLVIENQQLLHAAAPDFAQALRKKGWRISPDHLNFRLLRSRTQALQEEFGKQIGRQGSKHLAETYSEFIRRLSFGLSGYSFTLLGVAYGLGISRCPSKRRVLYVLALAALSLTAFFLGKEFDHLFLVATSLFLLPHVWIFASSIWTIRKVARGFE